jgi:hypothetical protein
MFLRTEISAVTEWRHIIANKTAAKLRSEENFMMRRQDPIQSTDSDSNRTNDQKQMQIQPSLVL